MQTIDPQSLMKRGLDDLVQRAKGEDLVARGKITAPRSRDYDPAPAKKAERPCFATRGYKRPKVSRERF
jgi:hypothetical protein